MGSSASGVSRSPGSTPELRPGAAPYGTGFFDKAEGYLRDLRAAREESLGTNHATTYELAQLFAKHTNLARPEDVSSVGGQQRLAVCPWTDLKAELSKGKLDMASSFMDVAIDVTALPEDAIIVFVCGAIELNKRIAVLQKVATTVLQKVAKDLNSAEKSVYFCTDLGNDNGKDLESRCLLVAMSDALIILRVGSEDEQPTPRQSATDPGQIWMNCAQFVATSPFQQTFRGRPMPVFSASSDGMQDITEHTRRNFHEHRSWALPALSLEDYEQRPDIQKLEPVIVLMSENTIPRVVAAAVYNLPGSLRLFLDAKGDINATMPKTGDTPLMLAASRHDVAMVRRCLEDPSVQVNKTNSLGRTACHALLSISSLRNHSVDLEMQKELASLLMAAKGDPTIACKRGKTAIDFVAMRHGNVSVFPGYADYQAQRVAEMGDHNWAYKRDGLLKITQHQRQMESGNVVSWRQVDPLGKEAKDLMICLPTALMSSLTFLEFAVQVCLWSMKRVIIIDLPGTGHSVIREDGIHHFNDAVNKFTNFDTTEAMMDYYMKDVETVFVSEKWNLGLDMQGAHLVACSFGALCLGHLAIKHPEWAKTVTLFSWCYSYSWDPGLIDVFDGLISHIGNCSIEEAKVACATFVVETADQEMKDIMANAITSDVEGFLENRMVLLSAAVCKCWQNKLDLGKLQMPVLVCSGEMDAGFIDHAFHLEMELPHLEFALVDKVAHIAPLENALQSTHLVLNFLAKASGKKSASSFGSGSSAGQSRRSGGY